MVQLALMQKDKIGVTIDPIYQFSATEIMKRFYEVVDNIIDQIKATPASCMVIP